jgi:ribosomal-protein-alanine N-acetyltransferase
LHCELRDLRKTRKLVDVQFTIRPYRGADFDRLWEIDQLCFLPGIAYTQMELSGFITARNAITLVAELPAIRESHPLDEEKPEPDDGSRAPKATLLTEPETSTLAGFIVAHAVRRQFGRILTLDVAPGARRLGLGSQLIVECEERLRAHGCRQMFLETAVTNHAAIQLYQHHGYQVIRTLADYYASHSLDAFLMGKDL